MSTKVAVYSYALGKHEDSLRSPLDSPSMAEHADWTVLTWVRNKPTWIEAKLYSRLRHHPWLASSLLLLKSPDWQTTICIYPCSGIGANVDLLVDTKGDAPVILANARRCIPDKDVSVHVVYVHVEGGASERNIVKRAVEEARKLVGGQPKGDNRDLFFKGLGVCTWESLKHTIRPTKDNLLELIPKLPIQTFLIDDGWQDVSDKRRLMSFSQWDGMGAPMKEVVSSIKEKGRCEVGVWITLQGYWLAIDSRSPLIHKYKCLELKRARDGQPRGGVNIPLDVDKETQWLPRPDMAQQFWFDYFTEMKSWGIGFVKVDNQAHYDAISAPEAPHVGQAMWSGMLEAAVLVFGSTHRVIMCMSHNERMLNGPGGLDCDRPPGNLVFRNSDDYALNYDTTHPDHIKNNLYGNVLTGHLSLVPDYDMWASNPPDHLPVYHALLRVMGPGPCLLSDTPDVHTNHALLDRMLGVTKDGRQVIARTEEPAQVLAHRWFWDNLQGDRDGPALVAGVPMPLAQGALMGSWNLRDPKYGANARDHLTRRDVEEALGVDRLEDEYAVYSMGLSGANGGLVEVWDNTAERKIEFQLGRGECEGWVVAKVWNVGGKKLAVLGLLDKLAPLAGVTVHGVGHGELVIESSWESGSLVVLQIGPRGDLNITVDSRSVSTVSTNEIGGHSISSIPLEMAAAGQSGSWVVRIS